MVRVVLPQHLRTLAHVGREVTLDVSGPVSVGSVLTALEGTYPVLKGTIREHGTLKRRAFIRFFADGQDISLESPDLKLPNGIAEGREPLLVIGAIAGG
jgi:molybdopterin synthase sulfur carrier subunit